jgi:DNA-binding MarR family transcriptional regulator
MKKQKAPEPTPQNPDADQAAFRARLEQEKHGSTLQLLFKAARLLDEQATQRAARQQGAPLRRSHMSLLPHIDLDGTRITDLAERLGVSKQAASQLVDDLEGFGVVERVADADDARARRVVFTKRGRAGFFEGLALLREMEQELAAAVGAQRMRQLRAALLAILEHVEVSEM